MNPIVTVLGCMQGESQDKFRKLSNDIRQTMAEVKPLGLTPGQVSCHFPIELYTGNEDITIRVSGLSDETKSPPFIRRLLAERLQVLTRGYFPQVRTITCFIEAFHQHKGFSSSTNRAEYKVVRFSRDARKAILQKIRDGASHVFFDACEEESLRPLTAEEETDLRTTGGTLLPDQPENVPQRFFCSMAEFLAWREKREVHYQLARFCQKELSQEAMTKEEKQTAQNNFLRIFFGRANMDEILAEIETEDFLVQVNEQETYDLKQKGEKIYDMIDAYCRRLNDYSKRDFADHLARAARRAKKASTAPQS